MATASRTLWVFSRENGLPFSNVLVRVDPKTRLPINAIIATLGINALLALISIGSFYSVVLAAYQSSFLLAACVMLREGLTTPASEMPWGLFRLKKLGVPITVVAICYTIMALFFSVWASFSVVDAAGMNYSCLIFGTSILFCITFWLLYGRKVYLGPVWEFEGQFVRVN